MCNNLIEFSEEELDMILALVKQEGFESVQEAIISAVRACLKED